MKLIDKHPFQFMTLLGLIILLIGQAWVVAIGLYVFGVVIYRDPIWIVSMWSWE